MNNINLPLQSTSQTIWETKYQLKDGASKKVVDERVEDTFIRVANTLADVEVSHPNNTRTKDEVYTEFLDAIVNGGAYPAGRIMANAGAGEYKPKTSLINCTVSQEVKDSMEDILDSVKKAGLTLKAGCVSHDTLVITEEGCVTAKRAVIEEHNTILSYNINTKEYEYKNIEKHLITRVKRSENIKITSNRSILETSKNHPVLIFENNKFIYKNASELNVGNVLVHFNLPILGYDDLINNGISEEEILKAWWTGAHLGDGSAYLKVKNDYKYAKCEEIDSTNPRYVFKIMGKDEEIVSTYTHVINMLHNKELSYYSKVTPHGTKVYHLNTFDRQYINTLVPLIDNQVSNKSSTIFIPKWIKQDPVKYFIPFLAGLVDTDGNIHEDAVNITTSSKVIVDEIKSMIRMFGSNASSTLSTSKAHTIKLTGQKIPECTSFHIKIKDNRIIKALVDFMVCTSKAKKIREFNSKRDLNVTYYFTDKLREMIKSKEKGLTYLEKQKLGFYKQYFNKARVDLDIVTETTLDLWKKSFPDMEDEIKFVRTLYLIESIECDNDIDEVFYDFTVSDHHNYLAGKDGFVVIHNCGIGYEFSSLRPKGAYVSGAGAYTSGPLSFADIFDKMCATISSAGDRRGAQMLTFDISHPDVIDVIKAKREDGRLRNFNISLLITSEFMDAVNNNEDWYFKWEGKNFVDSNGVAAPSIPAAELWNLIMKSTYDFAEPGFILIDEVNYRNNLWFTENIRASNPCGEQMLPFNGSCLLGSINLVKYISDPFTSTASFDFKKFYKYCRTFARMLDNVVEINGLPLQEQRDEIYRKRRHGMGYLGLGSALSMLGMEYGSPEAINMTSLITMEMAIANLEEGVILAKEKGAAPIMYETFTLTQEMLDKIKSTNSNLVVGNSYSGAELFLHSNYINELYLLEGVAYNDDIRSKVASILNEIATHGIRYSHATSIAPTGTLALSFGNNVSNGIEPSFSHYYLRNTIVAGKNTKVQTPVYSYEYYLFKTLLLEGDSLKTLINYKNLKKAASNDDELIKILPEFFSVSDSVTPKKHVRMQAAAQQWIDSSISKTINVPTDIKFEEFEDIYSYAYEMGLKGCTTFRFNPAAFSGVLVKKEDLAATKYSFTTKDGVEHVVTGDTIIVYEGEEHVASNLFDALKEGQYGKY